MCAPGELGLLIWGARGEGLQLVLALGMLPESHALGLVLICVPLALILQWFVLCTHEQRGLTAVFVTLPVQYPCL